jgi:hypothetical protein
MSLHEQKVFSSGIRSIAFEWRQVSSLAFLVDRGCCARDCPIVETLADCFAGAFTEPLYRCL